MQIGVRFRYRLFTDVVDGATNHVFAEQCALRAVQYFDAFKIKQVEGRSTGPAHVNLVNEHDYRTVTAGVAIGGTDSAQGQIRGSRSTIGYSQARCKADHIGKAVDAQFVDEAIFQPGNGQKLAERLIIVVGGAGTFVFNTGYQLSTVDKLQARLLGKFIQCFVQCLG